MQWFSTWQYIRGPSLGLRQLLQVILDDNQGGEQLARQFCDTLPHGACTMSSLVTKAMSS